MSEIGAGTDGPDRIGVEVWRGGVNAWELDEMGHMNVRFYVARAIEGLIGLTAELGMPGAFAPTASATVMVREQHIRFLREAHAGWPQHMRGGVIEMGESEARLLLVLVNTDSGEPSATFQVVVRHVTPHDGRPFPWPKAVCERAAALKVEVPAYAAARSVSLAPFETTASLARADALGLVTLAAGAITPRDCDAFGRITLDGFIGRVSDGISRLLGGIRRSSAEQAGKPTERVGGAVLEYRVVYLDWPRLGDRLVVRSGVSLVEERVQRLVHWMLDPRTGRPWAVSESVGVTLDLDARKIMRLDEALRASLAPTTFPGLAL